MGKESSARILKKDEVHIAEIAVSNIFIGNMLTETPLRAFETSQSEDTTMADSSVPMLLYLHTVNSKHIHKYGMDVAS